MSDKEQMNQGLMERARERIMRAWRPEDYQKPEPEESEEQQDCDNSQDGGDQQDGQQGNPQDGQGNQDGGQQDGGQQGSGGSQQSGGQPANPYGSTPKRASGKPSKYEAPSLEDARHAKKVQQEDEKRSLEQQAKAAKRNKMSLEEFQKSFSPAKQSKYDYYQSLMSRKERMREGHRDIIEYSIPILDEDGTHVSNEWKAKKLDLGTNPKTNFQNYMRALKEVHEELEEAGVKDPSHHVSAGWGNYNSGIYDDDKVDEEKLEMSRLASNIDPEVNHQKTQSTFDPSTGLSKSKLNSSFSIFASKIAEDAVSWATIGDDEWDIPALMKRRYDNRPLSHCKQSREKSRLVLVLDTSGSCDRFSQFFASIAQSALSFGDVEIYEAPNGYITHKLIPKKGWQSVSVANSMDWGLQNRHIVFFGDWDGASRVIHNSQGNKLYWFDCERRQAEHYWLNDWSGEHGYQYAHFKGKRYKCYGIKDFMRLVKKIK